MAGEALLKLTGLKRLSLLVLGAALLAAPVAAQSRLQTMPGYDQWAKMAPLIPGGRYHCAEVGRWAQFERPDEHNRVVLDFLAG